MEKNKEIPCGLTTDGHCLDQQYWDARWENNQIAWDIGYASPAIKQYMSQYENKDAAILIPGCGNAYEAAYLLENNFTNITLIDIAPEAVRRLEDKFAGNQFVKVLCEDFFQHKGKYDVLIEQTFFCAIPVLKRKEYAETAASLLHTHGKIVGLLFDKTFTQPGPPFGGNTVEYQLIFSPFFAIKKMEKCDNSIKSREGAEVFINMIKLGE
ncbi:TPMT family class I SAM-dependent methyltransferase [Sphingobacterium sp. SRCM116780]|uniref:methyltransferase n=1 Tax=Sphingobacterium sp. SRCM116780 TaxID=2907623 RepID=UPI001F278C91|nr:methyltransferase [Sphingobacterium sp. SRCM116780]UIR54594.1 TPMT family class I SAM-dependent methyltransferase [Sphingobacterium sp. SRCM116780]